MIGSPRLLKMKRQFPRTCLLRREDSETSSCASANVNSLNYQDLVGDEDLDDSHHDDNPHDDNHDDDNHDDDNLDGDNDDDFIPQDVLDDAREATTLLIPEKSRKVYDRTYHSFKKILEEKRIKKISENVLLGYFNKLKRPPHAMVPGSLWSTYSMLKKTLNVYDNINIEKFSRLSLFLSGNERVSTHKKKKAHVFTEDEIAKFLQEAPDCMYLPAKVSKFNTLFYLDVVLKSRERLCKYISI